MKFKTVKEITQWRNFAFNDKVYDLSHLNAHQVEYIDDRDKNNPSMYRFIVTYGHHCFTRKDDIAHLSPDEIRLLLYSTPKESRLFDFERYELSRNLPAIIQSLGQKETLVCHAGYGKFATVKLLDSNEREITYFIPFAVFREKKKFRLHIQSAYPKNDKLGKIQKVNFFSIARNLWQNKKLPRPSH